MENRYLGNDKALAAIEQVGQASAQVTASAVQRINKSAQDLAENQASTTAQIMQGDIAQQTARATSRARQTSELGGLAEAIGQGVVNYQKQEAANAQAAQARAADELKQKQALLAEAQEEEYTKAFTEINELQNLVARDNWNDGVENYKARAAKTIAKYNLSEKRKQELIAQVYEQATKRDTLVSTKLEEEAEKYNNARYEQKYSQLRLKSEMDVSTIKGGLLPTEQAKPYLDNISQRLFEYLEADNGVPPHIKLNHVAKFTNEVLIPAYGSKAEQFAKYGQNIENLRIFATEEQQARLQYQSDNDIERYTNTVELAKKRLGIDVDFSRPGTNQKEAIERAAQARALNDSFVAEDKSFIEGFQFSPNGLRAMVATLYNQPDAEAQWEQSVLKDSAAFKYAKQVVARIRKRQSSLAELGVERAQVQQKIAQIDITKGNNWASVASDIAKKQAANKPLSAEELLFESVKPNLPPEALAILSEIGSTKSYSAAQVNQLQTILSTQNEYLERSKQAYSEEYIRRVEASNVEFQDIIQLFGGEPTAQILKAAQAQSSQVLTQEFQNLQERYQQLQQQRQQQFGATPNFSSAGQYAVVDQQIVPKTAVHVQTNNGDPFITPIAKANPKNHSFNMGMWGGGYGAGRPKGRRHAGIDFPLSRGEKAVSLVSGVVENIKNDPSGYGTYMDVRGDNGFIYRYAHISPLAKKGQRITAGQAIATPNGSGAGDPHLHFEVLPAHSYDAGKQYSKYATIDPVKHLRELTAKAGSKIPGTATRPTGATPQQTVASALPWMKTESSGWITNGGVVTNQLGYTQQIGKPTLQTKEVFNAKRTPKPGSAHFVNPPRREYNPNSDFGYAYFRQNPDVAKEIVNAAKILRVPAEWIADIAMQESGQGRLATKVHPGSPNQNYGLFGFGSDSGVSKHTRLTPVQQVRAYLNYMNSNGWMRHVAQKGESNLTIAQFWAMTRMGTNWRKQALNGRIDFNFNDTRKTYLQEIELLGKYVGRKYMPPAKARAQRNK